MTIRDDIARAVRDDLYLSNSADWHIIHEETHAVRCTLDDGKARTALAILIAVDPTVKNESAETIFKWLELCGFNAYITSRRDGIIRPTDDGRWEVFGHFY
jgi:hypothetical protein